MHGGWDTITKADIESYVGGLAETRSAGTPLTSTAPCNSYGAGSTTRTNWPGQTRSRAQTGPVGLVVVLDADDPILRLAEFHTLRCMTVARDELHHLVDELSDEQLDSALAELRRLATPPQRGPNAFAWIGSGVARNGRTDNAERVDELLAEGFGRD